MRALIRPQWLSMTAAIAAASVVVESLISARVFEYDERLQSISDIITACRFDPRITSAQLMKELDERFYWGCNLNVQRHLRKWDAAAQYELRKIISKWISENEVKQMFAEGALVRWSGSLTGVIWGVDPIEIATYLVVPKGVSIARSRKRQTGLQQVWFENAYAVEQVDFLLDTSEKLRRNASYSA